MNDEQINKFQRCIQIFADSIGALAEIEMMKAANEERRRHDYADAYDENAFYSIVKERGLDTNFIHERIWK